MNAHDTPLDPDAARGHHAATAEDVIEASRIVRRVIQNAMGAPNMIHAPEVQERKDRLIGEARLTLDAIRNLAGADVDDPWADAATISKSVMEGILDAPQLANNKFGRGVIRTQIVNGACEAVDPSGVVYSERQRLSEWL